MPWHNIDLWLSRSRTQQVQHHLLQGCSTASYRKNSMRALSYKVSFLGGKPADSEDFRLPTSNPRIQRSSYRVQRVAHWYWMLKLTNGKEDQDAGLHNTAHTRLRRHQVSVSSFTAAPAQLYTYLIPTPARAATSHFRALTRSNALFSNGR